MNGMRRDELSRKVCGWLARVRIAAGDGPFVRSKSDICITDNCINKLGLFYSALGAPFDDHYN